MSGAQRQPVLVVGATGGVGEGMCSALLAAGRHVVALGRSAERLDQLRVRLGSTPGTLTLETGDLDAPQADGAAVAERLRSAYGAFSGAIIAIGTWGRASQPILSVDDETWDAALANNLTSQFRAIRALVPILSVDGALVHVSGQSADFPYPGNAVIGLTNAARKSLVLSLAAELGGRGPRIYELIIGVVATRARRDAGQVDPRMITPEEIGRGALALIDGTAPEIEEALHYALHPGDVDAALSAVDPGGVDAAPAAADASGRTGGFRIDSKADIGHVALRVSSIPAALAFYVDALGFEVVHRMGDQAAFVAAGGYHHHVALLASPDPGLEHVAIRYPSQAALQAAVDQLQASGVALQGPVNHGETLSVYLQDPDANGIEIYIDL